MSTPFAKGPDDRLEIRSDRQRQETLLEEFAHLMGADVDTIRTSNTAGDGALGGAGQASPYHVTAVDRLAKRMTFYDFRSSIGGATSALEKSSPGFRSDELAGVTSVPRLTGSFAHGPLIWRRRAGRRKVTLTVLFVILAGGSFGAWALSSGLGARGGAPVDMAADQATKEPPLLPSRETSSSTQSSASGTRLDDPAKQDQAILPSNDNHASELFADKRLTTAPPDPSDASTSSMPHALPVTSSEAPSAAPTTVGQSADSGGNSISPPEPMEDKANRVRPGGSGPDDSPSSMDENSSMKSAEARALSPPSPPDRALAPHARPLSQGPADTARQAVTHKIVAPSKSVSKSINRAPTPKVVATVGRPRPLDEATAPGTGLAAAPEGAEAPHENTSSAEPMLQFVPTMFDRGVSAVRNLFGNATGGG
jgi:hypothetical protein